MDKINLGSYYISIEHQKGNSKMKIYPVSQIDRLMTGHWERLLSGYWDARAFNGRHQACPLCGGKDRFRWGESKQSPELRGKGMAICNQCGSHPGLWWFMSTVGMNFREALTEIGENFLHVEPNTDELPKIKPDGCGGYPKAPRIKCNDDSIAKSWVNRVNNDPDYDRKYWEARDLIESVLMFQDDSNI